MDRSEELVRRVAAATRASALYSADHPLVERNVAALAEACEVLFLSHATIGIGLLGREVVVNDRPLKSSAQFAPFSSGLQRRGVEKIAISRGARRQDLQALVRALAGSMSGSEIDSDLVAHGARHVSVGTVGITDPKKTDAAIEIAMRLYASSLQQAESVWDSVRAERTVDPTAVRGMVSSLSKMVSEDPVRLMALTHVKRTDNYTFTHMVNVSALTLAVAQSLRIDGTLLSEFGVAALMHDIGKVNTPPEILNKPGKLTAEEFEVMKRHTVDGANMLRAMPNLSGLAALTAFEHHLRPDMSGYPENITPRPLNLCTLIVAIADVFDALRTNRAYRQSVASDRVRAMLTQEQRRAFHPVLLKRFIDLVGLYPVGQYVRLKSGDLAVVTRANPFDAARPHVKVVMDRLGNWLAEPSVVNLWEKDDRGEFLDDIIASVEADSIGVDPLTLL